MQLTRGNFEVVTRMVTIIDLSGFYKDSSSSLGSRTVNILNAFEEAAHAQNN